MKKVRKKKQDGHTPSTRSTRVRSEGEDSVDDFSGELQVGGNNRLIVGLSNTLTRGDAQQSAMTGV